MSVSGTDIAAAYYAWNTSTGTVVTGDKANHTLNLMMDGSKASLTVGASGANITDQGGGLYTISTSHATGGNTGTMGNIEGTSSTSNVILIGVPWNNLDATIGSRMATYSQPTGFLAATFPGTVSSYAGADTSGTTTLLTRISGTINVTNLNTLSGHDPGATLGTSTLTQTQVSGYAGPILTDNSTGLVSAKLANTSHGGASATLALSQVTVTNSSGYAVHIESSSTAANAMEIKQTASSGTETGLLISSAHGSGVVFLSSNGTGFVIDGGGGTDILCSNGTFSTGIQGTITNTTQLGGVAAATALNAASNSSTIGGQLNDGTAPVALKSLVVINDSDVAVKFTTTADNTDAMQVTCSGNPSTSNGSALRLAAQNSGHDLHLSGDGTITGGVNQNVVINGNINGDLVGRVIGNSSAPFIGQGAIADLPDAPNATAVTAIQSGLSTAAQSTSILSAVNSITSNTARSAPRVPTWFLRPAAGTATVRIYLYLYNLQGILEDADTNTVTVHASTAAGGGDLNGNLASTTMTRESTGVYHVDYTIHSTDAIGEIIIDFAWTILTVAMKDAGAATVADADSIATLTNIDTNVDTLLTRVTGVVATESQLDGLIGAPLVMTAGKVWALDGNGNPIESQTDSTNNTNSIIAAIPTAAQNRVEMDANSTKLANIDTNVQAIADAEAAEGGIIPGGHAIILTFKDISNNPIPQLGVWVSSSSTGSPVVVQTVFTDNNGNLSLSLLPGTYYAWRFKAGYGDFTDPYIFTVT